MVFVGIMFYGTWWGKGRMSSDKWVGYSGAYRRGCDRMKEVRYHEVK